MIDEKINNKIISTDEVVEMLGVSSATIRNWLKHKYLKSTDERNKYFNYEEVLELSNKIKNGELDRLNKRANKRGSNNTFIPDEYADNGHVLEFVRRIIDEYHTNDLHDKSVLFVVILNLLRKKDLVTISSDFSVKARNSFIQSELEWWGQFASFDQHQDIYDAILKTDTPEVNDVLGLIYQSLSKEGSKAKAGSYYTPKNIVDEIVSGYVGDNSMFLDPCCGTGQFLISAAETIKEPNNIWGFDLDEIAVRLAKINLFLKYSHTDFSPNIYHKNTLLDINNSLFTEIDIPLFDVVATNPPWGVHLSRTETNQLQEIYPSIKSNETFSYFLTKSIKLLKPNGILSFVLPESILNVKTHNDIRRYLITETSVNKIKYLGRCFKKVFTPVIRMDVKNIKPKGDEVIIAENGIVHQVDQSRLSANPDYIFDIFNNNDDVSIFDKVYSVDHTTLANNSEWALGIVTGNNKKHLSDEKHDEYEPILTGKDIKRFMSLEPKKYIKYSPSNFQQVAPDYKYRAPEKLIYRFISKELVFSYDNNQTLTLNSANILIPKINNYPIKTILALFNSALYQFLHQKKFGSIKILRSDLEKLPLPLIDTNTHNTLIGKVDKLLNNKVDVVERKKIVTELDAAIMNIFNLSAKEREYVFNNISVSNKLLS